mgnify:CR=1 FL=1
MSKISFANWDGKQIVIKLNTGQIINCNSSNITSGGHEVLSCNVNGDEVQVLTRTKGTSSRATRMAIINKSGRVLKLKNI